MDYANFLQAAPWAAAPRDVVDVVQSIADENNGIVSELVLGFEGWHNMNLFEDLLHDDLIGVRLHLIGGILKQLADDGLWGGCDIGIWTVRLDFQLQCAFNQFCSWANEQNYSHSQARFSSLNLSMSVTTSWPVLKAKAKTAQMISRWLRMPAAALQRNEYEKVRFMTLTGFDDLYTIMEESKWPNWRLTVEQAARLEVARKEALLGYHYLAKEAISQGRFIYKLNPKHHKLDHLFRRSIRTRVSPTLFWTFVLESEMGVASRLVRRLHGASSLRRGVDRYLIYFWHRLCDNSDA